MNSLTNSDVTPLSVADLSLWLVQPDFVETILPGNPLDSVGTGNPLTVQTTV